jgi:hypothetical protein
MDKNYKELIWTKHALKRLKERDIKQSDAYAVWRRPDRSKYSRKKGAWVYTRNMGKREIEVVAKKNEKDKWLVLSVWDKPARVKKENSSNLLAKLQKLIFN